MNVFASRTLYAAILAGIVAGSTTTAQAGGFGGIVKSAKSFGGTVSGGFKRNVPKVGTGQRPRKRPVLSPGKAFRTVHRHVKIRVDPHIRKGKSELQKKGIGKPSTRKLQAERQRWKQRVLIERDNASRFFNHRANGNNGNGGSRKSGSESNDGETRVGGFEASLQSSHTQGLSTLQILLKYRRPATIQRNLSQRRIFGR